jgi:hypothetical protein
MRELWEIIYVLLDLLLVLAGTIGLLGRFAVLILLLLPLILLLLITAAAAAVVKVKLHGRNSSYRSRCMNSFVVLPYLLTS